jgi:hypothetical protein
MVEHCNSVLARKHMFIEVHQIISKAVRQARNPGRIVVLAQ